MHIDLPNLTGIIPRDAEKAIATLRGEVERAHASVASVAAAITTPGPLTPTQLKQVHDALQANGSNPLNTTFLIGSGGTATGIGGAFSGPLQIGTHAQRLAAPVPSVNNTGFFEIDRNALYVVRSGAWQLEGNWLGDGGLIGSAPADLGLHDDGYRFWALDQDGLIFQWTGNVFRYAQGIIIGAFSARPAFSATYPGVLFLATDMGDQTWISDYPSGGWALLSGWGAPMRGTISPDQKPTASLTAADTGFLFYSTDFDRIYRWTGAAWADAPGQPTRGMIAYFASAFPPGTGWQKCDGSTVNISTSGGAVLNTVMPNIPNQTFIRAVTGATGGTGGATSVTLPSGNESADTTVQVGVGVNVAAAPHTHSVGPIPTIPPFYDLQAWIRL